jgi:ribonuclease VapC
MSGVVIDTSAAIAILTSEPSRDELLEDLAAADERLISAGSLVELGIVLEARIGPAAPGVIDRFLRDGGIDLVPVERGHVDRALEGWRRYGRGRHAAALNLGDLFAYAVAVSAGYPVLCTGEDFAATDVDVVRPSSRAGSAA